jgi:hypothetical protein
MLEGSFNGSSMSTALRSQGLVPAAQPYNTAPFNYAGTETLATTSTQVVDWVLVELRTGSASSTMLARKAALLMADGSIIESNGSALRFAEITDGSTYHIVIFHRNHLGIMSSAKVGAGSDCKVVYNFTGNATAA